METGLYTQQELKIRRATLVDVLMVIDKNKKENFSAIYSLDFIKRICTQEVDIITDLIIKNGVGMSAQ